MTFTKYASNPILTLGAGGTWDDDAVRELDVLYLNNIWYMYYTGYDGAEYQIGVATSEDGYNFTKYASNPILSKSGAGWDDTQIAKPGVVYVNGIWYMYYTGYDGIKYKIGVATSEDGYNFTKYASNPILSPTIAWEDTEVDYSKIIYVNGIWYMYYTGKYAQIGVATSEDGYNFTKYASNPVLSPSGAGWDDTAVRYGNVLYQNKIWYMCYSGYDGVNYKIGVATSEDGYNFTKYASNPILSPVVAWENTHLYACNGIYVNGIWYMYYTARGVKYQIGVATSEDGY